MSGELLIRPSTVSGEIRIPGSKSHTIRALVFAALGDGESMIRNPLYAADTLSCRRALEKLGALYQEEAGALRVSGTGGQFRNPGKTIHVGNSGTSLRILTLSLIHI